MASERPAATVSELEAIVGDMRGVLTRIAYESKDEHAVGLARMILRCFDCDGSYDRRKMRDA